MIDSKNIWHPAFKAGWQRCCCCHGDGLFSLLALQFSSSLSYTLPFWSVCLVLISLSYIVSASDLSHLPPQTLPPRVRQSPPRARVRAYSHTCSRTSVTNEDEKLKKTTTENSLPFIHADKNFPSRCLRCPSVRLHPLLGVLQLFVSAAAAQRAAPSLRPLRRPAARRHPQFLFTAAGATRRGLPPSAARKVIRRHQSVKRRCNSINSVLMARLKATSMCDGAPGVCHGSRAWRDKAELEEVDGSLSLCESGGHRLGPFDQCNNNKKKDEMLCSFCSLWWGKSFKVNAEITPTHYIYIFYFLVLNCSLCVLGCNNHTKAHHGRAYVCALVASEHIPRRNTWHNKVGPTTSCLLCQNPPRLSGSVYSYVTPCGLLRKFFFFPFSSSLISFTGHNLSGQSATFGAGGEIFQSKSS